MGVSAYNYQFLYVATFFVLGLAIPGGMFFGSWMLRPKRAYAEKVATYESGALPYGAGWIQYNVRYYMFAILFVVFDVETVFLFPWAVDFRPLGLFGFWEMVVFIFMLLFGLVYAWKKRVLVWK